MAEGTSEQPCISRASEGTEQKDSPGAFQTDFSVTTRLLPAYNSSLAGGSSNNNASGVGSQSLPFKQTPYPTSPPQGSNPPPIVVPSNWQGYVPPTYPNPWGTNTGSMDNADPLSPGPSGGYVQQGWKPLPVLQGTSGLKIEDRVDDDNESDTGSSSRSNSSNGDLEGMDEPKKPKRTRTAYSNSQLDQLELAFSRSHYPDVFTREDLSNKLNIKEDRIQVWFQNRRARYRKQERTGSVSLRSKYRQKRLQRLQQNQATMGYYHQCGPSPTGGMIAASPQPAMTPYMPGFHFPPNYAVSGISPSGGAKGTSAAAGAIAASATPFSANYVAMNFATNTAVSLSPSAMGSAYSTLPPSNSLITPVSQK